MLYSQQEISEEFLLLISFVLPLYLPTSAKYDSVKYCLLIKNSKGYS